MKRKFLIPFVAVAILGGIACNGNGNGTSDERPTEPKKIAKKRIDDPRCEKKKGKTCTKWDDRDWVLITSDGTAYDVDESEYNSVNIGDFWPK